MIYAIRENWLERVAADFANNEKQGEISAQNAALTEISAQIDEYKSGSVAVLPLFGVITQHPEWFGTSSDAFGETFDRAIASDRISGIVINIHSPGGSTWGTQELADKIFAARGSKPIVAVANSMACSAAYWIGTAAERLNVTTGGEVGAIGVYTYHFEEIEGENGEIDAGAFGQFKKKVYSAPAKKAEVAGISSRSEETDAEIQGEVEAIYRQFVDAVARNVGTTTENVRANFGGGGVRLASEAVAAGMASKVATLDETVASLVGDTSRGRRRHSSANKRAIQLANLE